MSPEQRSWQDRTVLAAIERAAQQRLPCPTNSELADLIEVASVSGPVRVLARLEKRGVIAVERGQIARVVTIKASGLRTAGAISKAHWRVAGRDPAREEQRAADRKARTRQNHVANVFADPPLPDDFAPIERDPCFKCGTRGDMECAHRKPTAQPRPSPPDGPCWGCVCASVCPFPNDCRIYALAFKSEAA